LTPQSKASALKATELMRTLIPQDSREAVNAMVPSSTLLLQDRTALVNAIVPASIFIPRNKHGFGTSSTGDKTSKTLKFASVIATYWDDK
jgi:hypothetical protein